MDALLENFELVVFVALFAVGYVFGRWNEKRHYASIRARETALAGVTVFSNRFPPVSAQRVDTALVSGSVVIAEDYFKNVVSGLYNLVGGRVRSYESLLDRARREAVLRMKEDAKRRGSALIVIVKFQTLAIGGRNPYTPRGVASPASGPSLSTSR